MKTSKEIMRSLYQHEQSERILPNADVVAGVIMPGDFFVGGPEGEDAWGVRWTNTGESLQYDGFTPTPGYSVLKDIRDWKDVVRFPDYSKIPLQPIFDMMLKAVDRGTQLLNGVLLCGTFERMHSLMGMENAMCAFYDEPNAVHELFDAITDSRIDALEHMIDIIKPDVIRINDDWGMNRNMFFPEALWREFFKPIEKRYAEYIHGKGLPYEHHSCGYIAPLIEDAIEVGIDALNPWNLCNDIESLMKKHGKDIFFIGGLDGQLIDTPSTTEEEIRKEVRRAIDAYGSLGLYSPFYIATNQEREMITIDEAYRYGLR